MRKRQGWMRRAGAMGAGLAWMGMAGAGELAMGGAGAAYDGAIRGVERQSAALPFVYYEGERLGVVFTTASWHLVRNGSFRLSLVGAGRFDGYQASDSPYLAGMRTRDPALDAGLEAAYGNLSLSVVTDASGTHQGSEAALTYTHGIELGRLQLQIAPGVRWQDRHLAGYYFGVREDERAIVQVDGQPWLREAYAPGHALVPRLGLLAQYRTSSRWSLIAGAEVARLPATISDSPIVGRSTQWGFFSGAAFHFR